MYGLLCENLRDMIIQNHGEAMWVRVRELAGVKSQSFVLHNVYSDAIVACMAQAYAEITSTSVDSIMKELGIAFVAFVEKNGYNDLLKVLGRNMRDFLNGLDSLHEYLRFSYTKLKPPSFFVEMETARGMILHYRSKRVGFLHYVAGQIEEVGRKFYNLKVETEVLDYKLDENGCHVVMNLIFDNKAYVKQLQCEENSLCGLFLDIEMFFDIFPFYIMYDRSLAITGIGSSIRNSLTGEELIGKKLTELFHVVRPTFEFTWRNVIHTNVIFELIAKPSLYGTKDSENGDDDAIEQLASNKNGHRLHLKGHMMFIQVLEMMLFLSSPVLDSLDTMQNMGVYINDLALHDSSRDLVLQSVHQSLELKQILDSEKVKSAQLEESVQSLEMERKKADALLYRMIPKQIAGRLRKGESALDTCETFENVTILFSDVVGFTNICTQISPMDVVSLLNSMYIKFDQLSEKYRVYKVETIGDGYMLAGGIPSRTPKHADNVADMALKMLEIIKSVPNPAEAELNKHLEIRTGIHSGMVVAGVVGVKMPRYCLFGETVNIASRMESNGLPNACHISQTTLEALTPGRYKIKPRGTFEAKPGNFITTHWILGKTGDCYVTEGPTGEPSVDTIERPLSRGEPCPSPIYVSASQRIISTPCTAMSNGESDLIASPTNMLSQFTFQEIERFIRENDLELFSDKNATPDRGEEFHCHKEAKLADNEYSPSISDNSTNSDEFAKEHSFSEVSCKNESNAEAEKASFKQDERENNERGQKRRSQGKSTHQKCILL